MTFSWRRLAVVRMEETSYMTATDDAALTLTPLPDASTALLHMEWTRNRHIVRWLTGIIIGLFVLISVFVRRGGRNDLEGILVLMSVSSGYIGFAVGAWLGGEIWESKSGEMKPMQSALPFSDAQLGTVLLGAWLEMTTIVWLLVVMAMLVLLAIYGIVTGTENLGQQVRDLWLVQQQGWLTVLVLPASSFLVAWTLSGLAGSVVLTGRKWLGFGTLIDIPTIGVVFLVIYPYFGEPGQRLASALLLCFVLIVCCGGTACVYANAVIRRLLTGSQVVVCAAAVVLLCVAT